MKIKDLNTLNNVNKMKILNHYPHLAIYMNDLDVEIQKSLVLKNSDNLKYIRNPTFEAIKIAIAKDYNSYKFINKTLTTDLMIDLAKINFKVVKFMNQTKEFQLQLIENFVEDRFNNDKESLFKSLINPDEEVIQKLLSKDGTFIEFIDNPTMHHLETAVITYPGAITHYTKYKLISHEFLEKLIKINISCLNYANIVTFDIIKIAIDNNPSLIEDYYDKLSVDIIKEALKKNIYSFNIIKDKLSKNDIKECILAVPDLITKVDDVDILKEISYNIDIAKVDNLLGILSNDTILNKDSHSTYWDQPPII